MNSCVARICLALRDILETFFLSFWSFLMASIDKTTMNTAFCSISLQKVDHKKQLA